MMLWCKSGLCPQTSSPEQSHPWFTECSPQTGKKVKKLWVIHSTWQITALPSEPVPHSHKCLMFPSPSQGHSWTHEWSTSSEGAGSKSLWNKRCKKDFKKHTYRSVTTKSSVLHVKIPRPCFVPQLHSWRSGHKSDVICPYMGTG